MTVCGRRMPRSQLLAHATLVYAGAISRPCFTTALGAGRVERRIQAGCRTLRFQGCGFRANLSTFRTFTAALILVPPGGWSVSDNN